MQTNEDLVCSICGGEDLSGKVYSTLTLTAGYGSVEHDMEVVKVPLCGECCDKLFAELSRCRGAVIESPW